MLTYDRIIGRYGENNDNNINMKLRSYVREVMYDGARPISDFYISYILRIILCTGSERAISQKMKWDG